VRIVGLFCADGDINNLPKPWAISGSLEHQLPPMVDGQREAFRDALFTPLSEINSAALSDWLLTFPVHVSLLTLTIAFCLEVEEYFNQSESNIHVFQSYEVSLTKTLVSICELTQTPLALLDVQKAGILIALVSSHLEIMKYRAKLQADTATQRPVVNIG
jgi:hypothetical protein